MQGKDEQPVKVYEKDIPNGKSQVALREEAILKFWKEGNIFEKSISKDAPKGNYVFYDGPPFATGLPHYGHILGSTAKDVIGRYQTMRGFRVPRRWGWDCHGLPIENIVEKDLGISGRKAIEEYGIEKFTEYAHSKVLTYVAEWKKTVDRIGRWVDFDNSYKTMDNTFIESVWWALSELNKKDLIYEGVRVLAYCSRCETPIANSEIAMDNSYKDITDISVYVKFELGDEPGTYMIAWTTTPWSLPGDTAIAVNKDITYIKVEEKETGNKYIFAKDVHEKMIPKFSGEIKVVEEFVGDKLVGKSYIPPFDYYKDVDMSNKENIWKVWHADFVTADQGTGIAHEAPAFGEDDMNLAKAHNIPWIIHVDNEGKFKKEVTDFVGLKVKPKEDHQSGDVAIIKYLAGKGLLFAKEKIIHSYPHCYRCDTPLLYYALPSWFVNIQKVKGKLLEDATSISWVPAHLKEGRFKNTMESAPDWTISRNRFWASPLPIWKSESGETLFISSIDDLTKYTKKSGNTYFIMRHGQTNHNLNNLVSSIRNSGSHLTEEGKSQIRMSADTLKDKKIDLIFVSPFNRTIESEKIVAEVLGLDEDKIIVDDRLHEMSLPMYEGKTWSEYHEAYPKTVENFDKAPEGNESYADVKRRMMSFMFDVEHTYQHKNILIVTHGSPAWLAISGTRMLNDEDTLALIRNKTDFHYLNNAEIQELPFVPFPHDAKYNLDLHRPYIDRVNLEKDGVVYTRITEVIDCWFESGSMPFAQDHYPFERPHWKEENFPAGFISEYIPQTRTWFYYTHVLSSILFGQAAYKNVVATGTVLAEDGQKMSKSKNNFPDPWIMFNKFGVDALRFYLLSSTVMKGEDVNFIERGVQEVASKIVSRFDNVVTFYELYRDISLEQGEHTDSQNVLDVWILSRMNELITFVTSGMESYDIALATRPFELFMEDLSTWYLRRSRERLKDGDADAKRTLYKVLKTTSKLLAPFAPFICEDVWQKLKHDTDVESVHLTEWPEEGEANLKVLEKMETARLIVTKGLELRQKAGIKIRQPLQSFSFESIDLQKYYGIIKEELNVKEVFNDEIKLDTHITLELRQEGKFRELLRALQDMRKSQGLNASDMIEVHIETNIEGQDLLNRFKAEIMKTAGVEELTVGQVEGGTEVAIDDLVFKVQMAKI